MSQFDKYFQEMIDIIKKTSPKPKKKLIFTQWKPRKNK